MRRQHRPGSDNSDLGQGMHACVCVARAVSLDVCDRDIVAYMPSNICVHRFAGTDMLRVGAITHVSHTAGWFAPVPGATG